MNHRPRRPGTGPSHHMHQNRGRQQQGVPPQQHQNPGFQPPPQQGMPPVPPHAGNQPPIRGRGPVPKRPPEPRFVNEGFYLPVRQNKPIPASVPAVDVEAISNALNQCSQELDVMERSGRPVGAPPEAIDDLVVVDMYTPRDKIPMSKRHQAAQIIARQGPAEEGEDIRRNELIQALKIAPHNTKVLQRSAPPQKSVISNNDELPEPKLLDQKPEQPPRKPQKQSENINPMLNVFEEFVGSDNTKESSELSQDKFGSRLMPDANAYKVKRTENAPAETGMSLDELHAYYASQKEVETQEEKAAREAILQPKDDNDLGGGFLSGLGGEPSQNQNLPVGGGLESGGFLSGLETGGEDQLNAVASRGLSAADRAQEQGGGANFLDSLNAFNQPGTQGRTDGVGRSDHPAMQERAGLEPGFGDVWEGSNISPEAKAYRDSVLGSERKPQQQMTYSDHPVLGATQYSEPPFPNALNQGVDAPSFLKKTKRQPTGKQFSQTRQANKEKKKKVKIGSNDQRRRRAIKTYFGQRPVWTLLAALVGIAIISSQGRYDPIREWVVMEPSWLLLSGFGLFALSLAWRFLSAKKPKEETMDDWTAEDLVRLEKRAYDSMQLQNRYMLLEPIVMTGFPNLDYIDDEHVNGIYGRDHILRYTPRALTVMCFTREEVLTYEGAIDLTSGQVVYENTNEFFYSDIATIGMVKSKVRRKFRFLNLVLPWRWFFIELIMRGLSGRPIDKSAANRKETFQISLKDGHRVQLILRDARVLSEHSFEELAPSADTKVLTAITDFVVAQKTDQLAGHR